MMPIGAGAVILGFDGDGCLDIVVGNFGQPAKLLRNTCSHGNHWLRVHLEGKSTNADGIGAKIEVTAGGKKQVRKTISGSSFMGQNIIDAHFGLGISSTVDSLSVYWPSGKVQLLSNLVADQRITVVEP